MAQFIDPLAFPEQYETLERLHCPIERQISHVWIPTHIFDHEAPQDHTTPFPVFWGDLSVGGTYDFRDHNNKHHRVMQPCSQILGDIMGGSHPVKKDSTPYLALLADTNGECTIGAPCILQESQVEPDWNGNAGCLLSDKAMIHILGRDKFFQY